MITFYAKEIATEGLYYTDSTPSFTQENYEYGVQMQYNEKTKHWEVNSEEDYD
jgi:hypothetical protein